MANVSSSNGLEKRPKLRFPGFDEPYRKIALGEIASLVNRTDSKSTAPIMMLSAGNGFIMQSEKYSRDNAGQSLKKYILLKQGELAYNHGASKAKQFGCCYELTEPEARIPYVYHCFKVNNTEYTPYIAAALNNAKMDKQLKRLVSSSVRMDGLLNISFEDYMSVTLYLPSLKEQKRIADFLKIIDERITTQEKLLASLKKYKRGLLNHVFSSKRHYKNDWTRKKIGEFCSIIMGQSPDSNSYNSEGIGVPLVQGNADITDGVTTPRRYTSQPTKMCKEGSILLSVRAPVGTVSIADREVCLGRGVCAINSEDNAFVRQLFLYLEPSWRTIEQGGTFTAISKDDIKNVEVIIPDNANKQKEIGEYFGLLDLLVSQEEKILQSSLSIKLALMQQLFI